MSDWIRRRVDFAVLQIRELMHSRPIKLVVVREDEATARKVAEEFQRQTGQAVEVEVHETMPYFVADFDVFEPFKEPGNITPLVEPWRKL